MKCPNCGAELQEGKLICEKCATEINYVPDFDPELENQITESLSDVAFALDDTNAYESPLSRNINEILSDPKEVTHVDRPDEFAITKNVVVKRGRFLAEEDWDLEESLSDEELDDFEFDEDFDDIPDDLPDDSFWDVNEVLNFGKKHNLIGNKTNNMTKIVVAVSVFVFVCILILVGFLFVNISRKNSYEYLIEQANNEYSDGNYISAVDYLEEAIKKEESTEADYIKLAEFYDAAELYDNSEAIYLDLIKKSEGKDLTLYEKLFSVYEKNSKPEAIYNIVSSNDSEEFREYFNKYLALAPLFSDPEGTYTDVLYLKISGNTSGRIFFTVDGSTPSANSMEYTSPIFLEGGFYQIKAIFINDYGFVSDVSTANYNIDIVKIDAPEINLEDGEYDHGNILVVTNMDVYAEQPVKIYYTTDGSEPSADCTQYTAPIFLPFGEHIFSFAAIDSEGRSSEIVQREINFTLDMSVVDTNAAIAQAFNYRYSLGGIDDYEGHVSTIGGRIFYTCDSCVSLNGTDYFVVVEYYEDGTSGISQRTGNVYGISNRDINDLGYIEQDSATSYYLRR